MRPLRTGAAILAAATIVIAGLSAPATAARPLPGVQGLTAAITKPGTAYHLAVDWADLTGATSYKVALKDAAGLVLASDVVAASAWGVDTAKPAMSVVRVTVTGFSATRRGKPVTISRTLPDLTAPTASYSVSWTGGDATITEDALSDDVTPAASITRELTWGDSGGTFAAWGSGTSLQHSYPLEPGRYVPQVRLTDQAGNTRTLDLHAVVVNDEAAPTGSFGLARPTNVWAKFTAVTVTQQAIDDLWTPNNLIAREVNWGDGLVQPWTSGTSLRHVYAVAGTFSPTVTLTDEAGNMTSPALPTASVTVAVDKVAPGVRLIVPKVGLRMVRNWRVIRGKAVDAGVGMGTARIKVIEKRGTVWYSYVPAKRVWLKAGTRTRAMALAGVASRRPGSTGLWSLGVKSLKKGTLVIQYSAVDRAGNRTKAALRKQRLSRW